MTTRILFFDIETTNLKADFGNLLCVGFKGLEDKKVYVPSIRDFPGKTIWDERPLLKEVHKQMSNADIWVSYYGTGFDVPYLTAKFLEYDLPVLPNIPHKDLYYTVKSNLAISRKSLQNVGYYLGLSHEKTPVEGKIWKKAMCGDEGSLKYIVDHCSADVLVLEELYLRLRPLIRMHPRVNGLAPCRYCGGEKLQKRGRILTHLKNEKQRIFCKSCGGWDSRAPA